MNVMICFKQLKFNKDSIKQLPSHVFGKIIPIISQRSWLNDISVEAGQGLTKLLTSLRGDETKNCYNDENNLLKTAK